MHGDFMYYPLTRGPRGRRFWFFNHDGAIVGRAYSEFTQHYPRAGLAGRRERDLGRLKRVVGTALGEANVSARQLAAVGITNQRETTVMWTATQVSRVPRNCLAGQANGWVLRRAQGAGLEETFRSKTGLVTDAHSFRDQGQVVTGQRRGA